MEKGFSKHSTIDQIKVNPTKWARDVELDKFLEMLKDLSSYYYNTKDELVDDCLFDLLVDIYNSRSKTEYSFIGSKVDDKEKVVLPVHMGSMDKTKTLSGMQKWLTKQPQNVNSFVITPKIDGTSALITFDIDSDEVNIYTRGDGHDGKRINFLKGVFFNDKVKSNVTKYLNEKSMTTFICRGEMIIKKKSFEKFDKDFKSPRSMVNGITNKKEIDEKLSKVMHVMEFMLFEIIEPKMNAESQFQLAKTLGFNYVSNTIFTRNDIEKDVKETNIETTKLGKTLLDYRNSYDYDIDGIIITSNIDYDLPELGNPEYSIALKINQSGEITKITNIEWNVSKHGQLIPTLEFDPITLGSSCVSKCTGFNGAFVFNNSIGPGAVIRVVLSGEVIPYITEVITKADKPQMPSCAYKWNETKIQCEIEDESDELSIQRITTFIKTINIDFLAQGMVTHLYKNGFTTLKSILLIKKEELLNLDRIEEKMANKILKSIQNKINNPIALSRLMDGSLSFGHGFGEKRCIQINTKFPNFMDVTPDFDSIKELQGWSDKSTNKFLEGLPKFKHFMEENSYLTIASIQQNSAKINNNSNSNSNSNLPKKVCITGTRDPEIIKFLNENNIEITSSVTTDIEVLICEDKSKTSTKIKQAEKREKEIITCDEFKKRFKI
jgi:DNA ligase (NAD+)